MSEDLKIRGVRYFVDTMRLSVEMTRKLGSDIEDCLMELETSFESDRENRSTYVRLVLGIWSLIDTAHRLRELVQSAPALKKKAPEVGTFIRETATVEVFRHYVQHLRSQIPNIPEQSPPVWGGISWTSQRTRWRFRMSVNSAAG